MPVTLTTHLCNETTLQLEVVHLSIDTYRVETFNNPPIDPTDLSTRPSLPNLVSLTHQLGDYSTYDAYLTQAHSSFQTTDLNETFVTESGEFLTRQTTYDE